LTVSTAIDSIEILKNKYKNEELAKKLIEKYKPKFKYSPYFDPEALNIKAIQDVQVGPLK